jgi:hypothetical protein
MEMDPASSLRAHEVEQRTTARLDDVNKPSAAQREPADSFSAAVPA